MSCKAVFLCLSVSMKLAPCLHRPRVTVIVTIASLGRVACRVVFGKHGGLLYCNAEFIRVYLCHFSVCNSTVVWTSSAFTLTVAVYCQRSIC